MQAWVHMECTSVRTLEKQTAQPLQFVHSHYTDNYKQVGFQQESQGSLPNIYIHKHTHTCAYLQTHILHTCRETCVSHMYPSRICFFMQRLIDTVKLT